jgi:hypothetical protein
VHFPGVQPRSRAEHEDFAVKSSGQFFFLNPELDQYISEAVILKTDLTGSHLKIHFREQICEHALDFSGNMATRESRLQEIPRPSVMFLSRLDCCRQEIDLSSRISEAAQ